MTTPIGPGLRALQATLRLSDAEVADLAARFPDPKLAGPAVFASAMLNAMEHLEDAGVSGNEYERVAAAINELLVDSKIILLREGPDALDVLLQTRIVVLQKMLRDWGIG